MTPIRVLLADDHPMFRYGLRAVLASDPATELVGEAASGDEAVVQATSLHPDVVLMDLTMPGLNGIEATQQILAACPGTRVVVVTMFDDTASVLAALRAGALGYLVKGADRDEILRAVHAAAAGQAILGAAAVRHVTSRLVTGSTPTGPSMFPSLTSREHDILGLLAAGYTNAAIAEQCRLSQKTVRNYVSVVLAKLDVSTRAEAVRRARDAGLG
jgi:DNA-binding NarL/FixJ family response regulator